MSFLGHVISNGCISIDPSKVDVVLEWCTSKSVTEIRSFRGLNGYYRRFIKGFSKLALLLTQLNRKRQEYVWNVHCEESFQELRKKLMSATILILPSTSESFFV